MGLKCNHKVLQVRGRGICYDREEKGMGDRFFEDAGRGCKPRNTGRSPKGEEQISAQSLRKKPALPTPAAPWTDSAGPQSCRRRQLCCLKPYVFGNLLQQPQETDTRTSQLERVELDFCHFATGVTERRNAPHGGYRQCPQSCPLHLHREVRLGEPRIRQRL